MEPAALEGQKTDAMREHRDKRAEEPWDGRLGVGGAGRDRTDDLRLAKPALSQLSYSP